MRMLAELAVRAAVVQVVITPYPLELPEHQILAAVAADIIEEHLHRQAAPAS